MKGIKSVKEVFGSFPFNKSPLAIVHINKQKGKAGFPFVIKPTASDDGLGWLFAAEPVHDQEKDKSLPSIVCIQKNRNCQEGQYAKKLLGTLFPEIFNGTKGKISKEQRKKDILFLIAVSIGKHIIPWNFRNAGEQKQISFVFPPVSGMKKAFYQKKTKNRKSNPSNITADPIKRITGVSKGKKGSHSRWILGKKDKCAVIDEHDHHGNDL